METPFYLDAIGEYLPERSEKARAICRAHWRETPAGKVHPKCCHGCPLIVPCHNGPTGYVHSKEFQRKWVEQHSEMNRLAEGVQ